MKIKKGDKVIVIAGKDRNKIAEVERVFPRSRKIVVAGVNTIKKHMKKTPKNPQGGIIDHQAPIDISNVMLIDPTSGKPTRVGYGKIENKNNRKSKVSNQFIK